MNTKLSPEDSRRLSILRFPLIVAVVFIHANNDRIGLADPMGGAELYVHWIRRLISEGLAAVAVPLFFLIAGYLFFAGWQFSGAGFQTKLRSRVRTLLVPYLLWNIALAIVLAIVHSMPQTRSLLSGKQGTFLESGPVAWISAILGLDGPPVVYQFWFLRDLMVAILLVPLWSAAHRYVPGFWAVLLVAVWFTHTWPISNPSIVSLLFFYLGSWIAVEGRSLFALDRAWPWLASLYALALIAEILGGYAQIHLVAILLGMATALGLTRHLHSKSVLGDRLYALAGSAFLVYALHEPLLTIVRRLAGKILGPFGPALDLILYLALPTAVIVFAWILNGVLRRWVPRFATVICGGR